MTFDPGAFFQEFFVSPIQSNGWFNPINTLVYSLILVVAVYYVFRLLRRMDIKIDGNFALALLPFILWASSTRVLHDAAVASALPPGVQEFYSLPIFPTPGSYFITFTLALAVLLTSLYIQSRRKVPYYRTMTLIGSALVVLNFILLPHLEFYPFLLIAGITFAWGFMFFLPTIIKRAPQSLKNIFTPENSFILSAHFLDATATVISITMFGYYEQHVLPRSLFPLIGPWAMFLLKAAVVIPVLWILDKYRSQDPQFIAFLKIVVLILGLAPGLRDMLRLMAGV